MAELALEQTLDLSDYLAAFRRRKGLILTVAGIVFLIGLIVAFVWPPTYEASATILIEEQEIPVELITATVTSYAAQRIQVHLSLSDEKPVLHDLRPAPLCLPPDLLPEGLRPGPAPGAQPAGHGKG